jgi:hypothetical protein
VFECDFLPFGLPRADGNSTYGILIFFPCAAIVVELWRLLPLAFTTTTVVCITDHLLVLSASGSPFLPTQGLWDPLKIPDVCEETHLDPYEFIYARYEFDDETQRTSPALINLYKKWPRLQLSPEVSNVCPVVCARVAKCYVGTLLLCIAWYAGEQMA